METKMNKRNIHKYSYKIMKLLVVLFIAIQCSCEKLVDVNPPTTQMVSTNVYNNNATATSVLAGLYSQMVSGAHKFTSGANSLGPLSGLLSDELMPINSNDNLVLQCYTNSLSSTNVPFWSEIYKYVYVTNAILEGLDKSSGVTAEVKQQLKGEALFMRAFFYFYLVNLWGDIPLITTTNYENNLALHRTPKLDVYKQIIADLLQAKELLNEDYLSADAITVTNEKVRPTKWAAIAMLARVYLYTEDWKDADSYADEIINNGPYRLDTNLNNTFLKKSSESIWQLQSVNPSFNTYDGNYYILTSEPSNVHPLILSSELMNSFELGDKRKTSWVSKYGNYYFPYKYKIQGGIGVPPVSEYFVILRLAEQYLIRAEAQIQEGHIDEGVNDLNILRSRARDSITVEIPNPLPPIPPGLSKSDALKALEHERQLELFTEWGNRWLDLLRWKGYNNTYHNRADEVLPLVKGVNWQHSDVLFPIPANDIQQDPNLTQNDGYN